MQKQVKEELKVESLVSWEKFCNSISLETDSNESWRKIKNFLKPKGQRDYSTLRHESKVAKTNADKAQLFAESVERHFGIESAHFDSNHFHQVNKFVEDNHRYFYPPEDPDDYRFDVGNEHKLWHGCKWNFAGPQIYLQPAKIKSQHFGVSLKFCTSNYMVCRAITD